MECLTTGFLQQRKEWLSQLRIGRHDYETRENYNLIGLVGPWVFDGLWFVGLFFFVGLLSYIELCGDDNFLVFSTAYIIILYIYTIVVSFYLSKLYFLPPKKNTDPACLNFFLKNFFTPRTLWQNVGIVCWKVFACLPALCRSFFFSSGRVAAGSPQFLGSHNRRVGG